MAGFKHLRKVVVAAVFYLAAVSVSMGRSGIETGDVWESGLKVGFAKSNITPPLGMRMCGFFYEVLNQGVHDSLYAKAFVFEQDETKFALVACDIAMVSPEVCRSVRERISSLGLPPENVLVHATETHNGPDYFGEFRQAFHSAALEEYGLDPAEPIDYADFLVDKIVNAIENADSLLETSSLSYSTGRATGISFNRRYHMKDGSIGWNPGKLNPDIVKPSGSVDASIPILAVHRNNKEKPDAIISGFAMHLALLEEEPKALYSADYPYFIGQGLKKGIRPDLFTYYFQPPCNEVNHIDVTSAMAQGGYGYAKKIGNQLADSIQRSMENAEFVVPKLKTASKTIDLELQSFTGEHRAEQREIWFGTDKTNLPFLEVVHAATVTGIADRHEGGPVSVLLQAFQLSDDIAVIGLPSEVSVELGLAIKKRSPYANTITINLSNDWIGYVPTERTFREGNYEAVVAKIKPGEGERMVEEVLRTLSDLKKR